MRVYPDYYKRIHNYIKKSFHPKNIKKNFWLLNIRMINLWLNELKLIAQYRNINDYENKSKEDLIKAVSEPKPKPKIGINKKNYERFLQTKT